MNGNYNFNFGLFAGGRQSAYSHLDMKHQDENAENNKTSINKPEILEAPRSQRLNNKNWLG